MTWYNSEGRIDQEGKGGRYRQLADGLGGYMIEAKPTEAEDQGDWKCVVTSDDGAMSVTTCDVKMISMSFVKLHAIMVSYFSFYSSKTFP